MNKKRVPNLKDNKMTGIIWLDHILLYLITICGTNSYTLSINYGIELTYPKSVDIMSLVTGMMNSIFLLVLGNTGNF